MSEKSKRVDKNWMKKAGLDLRREKTPIVKKDLALAREEGRPVPKSSTAHVHAHDVKRSKKLKGDDIQSVVNVLRDDVRKRAKKGEVYCDAKEFEEEGVEEGDKK